MIESNYCKCGCGNVILFKPYHVRHGIPKFLPYHQWNVLEIREKVSKAHTGKKLSLLTRDKIRVQHLGRKHTEEAKLKMSLKLRGKKSWNKGLTKQTDFRLQKAGEKISAGLKSRYEKMGGKRPVEVGNKISKSLLDGYQTGEIKNWNAGKTKETSLGLKTISEKYYKPEAILARTVGIRKYFANGGTRWNKGKTKETDPRVKDLGQKTSKGLRRLFESGYSRKWKERLFNTKPELKMKEILNELQIPYDFQKLIPKIGVVDFYLPNSNTLLFVDGCFWHSCPKCFPEDSKMYENLHVDIKEAVFRKRERDVFVSKRCNDLNLPVIRLWEHEINKEFEKVHEKLQMLSNRVKELESKLPPSF